MSTRPEQPPGNGGLIAYRLERLERRVEELEDTVKRLMWVIVGGLGTVTVALLTAILAVVVQRGGSP